MSKLPNDVKARLLWGDDKCRVVLRLPKYGKTEVYVEETEGEDAFGDPVWVARSYREFLKLKDAASCPSK